MGRAFTGKSVAEGRHSVLLCRPSVRQITLWGCGAKERWEVRPPKPPLNKRTDLKK